MPDYNWKISFILNGAKCEKTVSEGNWSVNGLTPKNGERRVRFTRKFTNKQYQDYWDVYDSAQKQVNDLLDAMSAGLLFDLEYIYFPTLSDFEVVLENEVELKRAGKQVPSRSTTKFTYSLSINRDNFKVILNNLSKIASSSNKEIIRHCLHLYRRGLSYEDLFDKFFAMWRAFNALYNYFSKKGSETQKMKEALQRLEHRDRNLLINTYSNVPDSSELAFILAKHNYNLFNYLISKNLVDDYNHNRSQELRQALSVGQSEDIIRSAILCLYVIRCKYVHASDSQITKEERVFQVSSILLTKILGYLLNKLV